jgi:iron-sulfur cluster assembly accessory protein
MSGIESNAVGVRVAVKSGGCAGMSYVMEYAKDINPNDEIIEDKGVKVFVDAAAVMYLLGTEMDYKKEDFSASFVFNYFITWINFFCIFHNIRHTCTTTRFNSNSNTYCIGLYT